MDILEMGGYGYKTYWDGDICWDGQGKNVHLRVTCVYLQLCGLRDLA